VLEATRQPTEFLLGASPRAGLAWVRAAQALAVLNNRDYCIPDDFKELAVPVLAHRVMPLDAAMDNGHVTAAELAIAALLERITAPR
jgi:MoxR-like ATPase